MRDVALVLHVSLVWSEATVSAIGMTPSSAGALRICTVLLDTHLGDDPLRLLCVCQHIQQEIPDVRDPNLLAAPKLRQVELERRLVPFQLSHLASFVTRQNLDESIAAVF
jgi:hypothetical protein